MNQLSYRILLIALLFLGALNTYAENSAQDKNNTPTIKDLGNNQYQVGNIHIDKKRKQFTVTGNVIRNEPPIEFIAVTKGGEKSYESLLELNTNAFEFNLACILIGLDEKKGRSSTVHFSPEPLKGDKVKISISWKHNGKLEEFSASELLINEKKAISSDWVYTGSTYGPNGRYLADHAGTLIGFVHAVSTIIEHRTGVGLGNYGGITVSNKFPPAGKNITIKITKE